MEHATAYPTRRPVVTLTHIVCGIDGGQRANTAVGQALSLAGDGHVTFVAVLPVARPGTGDARSRAEHRAAADLDAAQAAARDRGVASDTLVVHSADPADALMEAAADADLLVIGAPQASRVGGIAQGATSARLLHRARTPVLVARDPHPEATFPKRIVLATDGSPGSDCAADLTATVAATQRGRVTMVHGGGMRGEHREHMLRQARWITDATGTEPAWSVPNTPPVAAVCSCAEWHRASLIVIGARGVNGLRALGSVSERVAHAAPCSVLVARG